MLSDLFLFFYSANDAIFTRIKFGSLNACTWQLCNSDTRIDCKSSLLVCDETTKVVI